MKTNLYFRSLSLVHQPGSDGALLARCSARCPGAAGAHRGALLMERGPAGAGHGPGSFPVWAAAPRGAGGTGEGVTRAVAAAEYSRG